MNRLDVYTAVHKMQRARLFNLTVEAGKTDPDDTLATARLAAAVDALAAELVAHGEHEDRFIHPLLRQQAPALAETLDAAHVELDARLERLRQLSSASATSPGDPNVLYRALAAFTATYLDHLALEETEALPPCGRAAPTRSSQASSSRSKAPARTLRTSPHSSPSSPRSTRPR